MKNKITINNLEDEFFSRLASAIEVDFPSENSALIAISTLSMIWHKYNISDYMKTFKVDKKAYKKYFKKNISIPTVHKHLFSKEFKSKEIYDKNFNVTFELVYKSIKSCEKIEPRKQDVIIGMLKIFRERIIELDPTILDKDISTNEYYKHLDEPFS